MELTIFAEIGILIGIATFMALLMRLMRQPLIVGHIITGFLVGRFALHLFQNMETLQLFSELGISFLLFTVGLTLSPKLLKEYGWVSTVTGFGQVFLTGGVGIIICILMGYDWITSLYVGIALAFSSTVIVLKLLSDKGDLDKLYVKLSVGSLLLQDLIAIVLLFAIPFVTGKYGNGAEVIKVILLGLLAGFGVYIFSKYVITYLHPYLTHSHELLFLFAISWGMGVSALFAGLGFSLEGGALIAGVALSMLPSRHEISAKLGPLRDFFIVAFFITLGTRMVVSDFQAIVWPALILSIFVLLGNPLMQLIVMGAMGYRKKTSFQTGMMAAQISEFSLILVALGVSLGQVSQTVLSVVTLVGIITIFISSYLILYSDKLYLYVADYLNIFQKKQIVERPIRTLTNTAVLIGGNRIGFDFIELFSEGKKKFLVIDYDPDVISKLEELKIPHEYGDANDPDLLEELKINKAKIVVSTVPDLQTNLIVLGCAKRDKKSPIVIVVAHQVGDALTLYDAGADYVILPHFLGATYAASLVRKFTEEALDFGEVRDKHIKHLHTRVAQGHEHPHIDRSRL